MWLLNSSVGKKVIMSVSGIALVLFLLFHMSMNLVAIFSGEAYNAICEFLGANWYALVATAGLAALVIVHFVYAIILTLQNKKARGGQAYAYTAKPKEVEWASQNMFVLGVIVILGMGLHLYNFWANMQLVEVMHMLVANTFFVTLFFFTREYFTYIFLFTWYVLSPPCRCALFALCMLF